MISKSRERQKQLQSIPYREPASNLVWFTFATLNVLDIYSTHKVMKYECVRELNPFLPEVPTIAEMIALKTFILYPALKATNEEYTITNDDMVIPNLITLTAVINNINVKRRVKDSCKKR